MHHSLVRSQPTKLRMLRDLAGYFAKFSPEVLNFTAYKLFAGSSTDQFISCTERQGDTGAKKVVIRTEKGGSKCIFCARVDRIAARSVFERKMQVTCLERLDSVLP